MTVQTRSFADKVKWDGKTKNAISVRDGVLEYYGHEIGELPEDKVFTVYRSPATIAKVRDLMVGIPVTMGHVSTDEPVAKPVGEVTAAEVVDLFEDDTDSRLGVKNSIEIGDDMLESLDSGKRELSLGYKGELRPHHKYDFEQFNIIPHHLAGDIDAGRCGPSCSFLDKKPNGESPMKKVTRAVKKAFRDNIKRKKPVLMKSFVDADGQPNLQQIVEFAQQIPEAIKTMPVDELQEVLPTLQAVIVASGVASTEEAEELVDEEMLDKDKELTDEDKDKKLTDEDKEAEAEKKFADSRRFKDSINQAVQRHTEVIEKARDFLDDNYSFSGKSTAKVMRDALAAEHGSQSFNDSELSVAFKLLKKTNNQLQSFGDSAGNGLVAQLARMAKGE